MAYDPGTEAMLLFGDGYHGEFNDTWTLRDPSPVADFGATARSPGSASCRVQVGQL
jgi:hypothetical protein